ncbi:hypothetical protein [Candidatus Nitrosocosmicus sp. R]
MDIIAGSSIGAINATILTSHVIETSSYDGSAEKLIDFWHYLSKESMVEKNPFFEEWWDFWHSIYSHVASGEAARRVLLVQGIFAIWRTQRVHSHDTTI